MGARGRAVTSDPPAPTPDPTSRLWLPRGRRHVRPPGAGVRSGGADPGAARPFVVSARRSSPGPREWTLAPRRAQASCSGPEKLEDRDRKGDHGACPPARFLRARTARAPGAAPWVGRPSMGPKAQDGHPFPLKLGQEAGPPWAHASVPVPLSTVQFG